MNGKRVASQGDGKPKKKPKATGQARSGDAKKRAVRIIVAVVAVILALVIGALAWRRSFAQKPMIDPLDPVVVIVEVDDIGPPVRLDGDSTEYC